MARIHDEELQRLANNSRINNINVTWIGDPTKNWLITKNGVGMAGESYATKQETISRAREIASKQSNRPSVLIIERKKPNGDKRREATVSDWQHYKK